MPGSRSLGLALPCTDSWCDSTRGSSLTGHRCGLKEEVSGVAKGHPPLRSASGGHLRSVSCSFECPGPRSTLSVCLGVEGQRQPGEGWAVRPQ